ncbi:MAG: SCO3242 family prenyltransferase [Actinomycetes bacterium]
MTALRDVAELVRAPAALSVPGDSLAGSAASGWPAGRRAWALPLASASLYWAGMALNDYADRHLDATERPERPIPSGRVSPRTALGIATGLTLTGTGIAGAAGGRRSAALATALAAAVWAYDLSAKAGPLGAAAMAATRGLDVLLGASAGPSASLRAAVAPAALVTGHTAAVTVLSRGEVHGAKPGTARRALAVTALTAVLAALPSRGAGRLATALTVGSAATYALTVGAAQAAAARTGDAADVRAATGAGIKNLVWLQAALVAGRGSPAAAAALLVTGPVARLAMKVVSPT